MNSTSNPYPSYHGNFGEQQGLEWMSHDGAYQRSTILEPDQAWISQQLEDLMAMTAHMDTKLRELLDLSHKTQEILARLRAFTTTTPLTWNIPLQPTTSTSPSTAPYAQTVAHPQPEYTPHTHAGIKAFGYETSRNGAAYHRGTLEHAKKNHICHCGKAYTRRDSLRRHAAIHGSEFPYL